MTDLVPKLEIAVARMTKRNWIALIILGHSKMTMKPIPASSGTVFCLKEAWKKILQRRFLLVEIEPSHIFESRLLTSSGIQMEISP